MSYTREQAEEVLKDFSQTKPNILTSEVEQFLNHKFPKKESGWYKTIGGDKYLMYVDFENHLYYGFNRSGEWTDGLNIEGEYKVDLDYLATREEVEQRLIEEAKRRGFVEKAKYKTNWFEKDEIDYVNHSKWNYNNNTYGYITLCQLGKCWVFKNGKWAEIIEQVVPKIDYKKLNKKEIFQKLFLLESKVRFLESKTK